MVKRISYTKVWYFEAEYAEQTDVGATLKPSDAEDIVQMVQSDQANRPPTMGPQQEVSNVEGVLSLKPTAKPKKAKTVTFKPKQDREKEKRHQRISAKVAAYEGVELEAGEDGTKGKVIGAELRRPHSGTTKQWWLKIQWSDDPECENPTMCKERDVLQFIAGKSKDVDPGVNVTQPENMAQMGQSDRRIH